MWIIICFVLLLNVILLLCKSSKITELEEENYKQTIEIILLKEKIKEKEKEDNE